MRQGWWDIWFGFVGPHVACSRGHVRGHGSLYGLIKRRGDVGVKNIRGVGWASWPHGDVQERAHSPHVRGDCRVVLWKDDADAGAGAVVFHIIHCILAGPETAVPSAIRVNEFRIAEIVDGPGTAMDEGGAEATDLLHFLVGDAEQVVQIYLLRLRPLTGAFGLDLFIRMACIRSELYVFQGCRG